MITPPEFSYVSSAEFPELAKAFAANAQRKIDAVHVHHAMVLNQSVYKEMAGPKDEMGEWAGQTLCQRMWRLHTATRGWVDIGPHVTIDPAGRIWLGRDWDLPPASVAGLNGTTAFGPFMILLIGDFGAGREQPTDAQIDAAAMVAATIQQASGREDHDLYLRSDLTGDAASATPGLDKAALIAKVEKARKSLPKKDEKEKKSSPGLLAERERHVQTLLDATRNRAKGTGSAAPNFGDEMDECVGPSAQNTRLLSSEDAGAVTRGGAGAGDISQEMFRQMKKHLVHLRGGSFVEDGEYPTTESDIEEMVDGILAWAKSLPKGATPRLMIHAHGGLNNAQAALGYAWYMHRWWLDHHVYPIYFVWETGVLETVWDVVMSKFGAGERGFLDDMLSGGLDITVETFVRGFGQPFWAQMKTAAELAGDGRRRGGSYVLAKLLSDKLGAKNAPKVEIHAVGHSAGAIFHAHMLEDFKVPVKSLTLMAPAATVDLFNAKIRPLVDNGAIEKLRVFNLDRTAERDDHSLKVYRKSLLYLVSRGFEPEKGEPILGLEDSVRQDRKLARFLGIGGTSARTRLTWCPNEGNPQGRRSGARLHGDFDNDLATMRSVLWGILGEPSPDITTDPPQEPGARNLGRPLFTSISDRLEELFPGFATASAAPPPPLPPAAPVAALSAPAGTTVALGKRRALCIGINDYGGQYDLNGCVADTRLWGATFDGLDFDVTYLTDRDASRQGMVSSIEKLLRDSQQGDIAALHFSGHGTYMPDRDGDEAEVKPGDTQDEAWVPSDWTTNGDYLIDDDIWTLMGHLKDGVDCTFFIDCCHSETSSRMAPGPLGAAPHGDVRSRKIPPSPEMIANYRAARAKTRSTATRTYQGLEDMRHVQFSACLDRQTAKESGGHGWFTKSATNVLKAGTPIGTNAEMLQNLEAEFARLGYTGNAQNPMLFCNLASKSRRFLGGLVR